MKKMRIIIKKDGTTTMQVEGAVGEECLDFTRIFEEALGSVEERVMNEESEESESVSETTYERDEPAD
jgi:hypothetical protein